MDTEQVSAGIEQLVDHLRTNEGAVVELSDIAGVTEILLATMRRYFNSIDTTLYSEFRGLSEYIERARTEISELRPNDVKQEKIPRAGLELETIVASTEAATGTIMDAAEEIMSTDPGAENYSEAVNEACMRIFEACSFQDITGQRITKVVATLTYIEERLHGLQDAWGPDIADAEGTAPEVGKDADARPDSSLLNGPALVDEGIGQSQVDDLFNQTAPNENVVDLAEIEVAAPFSVAENADPMDVQVKAAGSAANGADEPKLDDIVALSADSDTTSSQDDIDALFD